MAQPFSARKPASSRSPSQLTVAATCASLPESGDSMRVRVFTIGHGTRSAEELVMRLQEASAETVIDVRRFPGSRRNPQFNQAPLMETLTAAGIAYRDAEELGGRRSNEPGEERFSCIRVAAFRSYAGRMAAESWQRALEVALGETGRCFMCAGTAWGRCLRLLSVVGHIARGYHN